MNIMSCQIYASIANDAIAINFLSFANSSNGYCEAYVKSP